MIITQALLDKIRSHGEETYPHECCGVMLGSFSSENVVQELYRTDNLHEDDHRRRYLIEPEDYRKAQKYARDNGLDVVGVYHSHPDHPARPSETDLQQATFPGFSYVIVSVEKGAAKNLTAWDLAPDRSQFIEEPVTIKTTA